MNTREGMGDEGSGLTGLPTSHPNELASEIELILTELFLDDPLTSACCLCIIYMYHGHGYYT